MKEKYTGSAKIVPICLKIGAAKALRCEVWVGLRLPGRESGCARRCRLLVGSQRGCGRTGPGPGYLPCAICTVKLFICSDFKRKQPGPFLSSGTWGTLHHQINNEPGLAKCKGKSPSKPTKIKKICSLPVPGCSLWKDFICQPVPHEIQLGMRSRLHATRSPPQSPGLALTPSVKRRALPGSGVAEGVCKDHLQNF